MTDHQVWYHGLRPKAREHVREHGLSAPPGTQPAKWFMLTNSHEQAKTYAGPEGSVLEYHIPHHLTNYRNPGAVLWPSHPHNVYDQEAHAVGIKGTLPNDYIVAEHPVRATGASHTASFVDSSKVAVADHRRTAAGKLPPDLAFHFTPSQNQHGHHELELHSRGNQVGKLSWGTDGDISGVETHPKHRRSGVGTALYTRAHELSREHGIPAPDSSVFQTPEGHAFRSHFDQLGKRPDVSGIPTHLHRGVGEDDTDLHEHLIKHHYQTSADMVRSWSPEQAREIHDKVTEYSPCGFQHQAAAEQPEKDAHLLRFHHEEFETGGSRYPNGEIIKAYHPEHGQVGALKYMRGTRVNSPILVERLEVHPDHQRKGYGSALMDTLQDRYPKAKIQHGDRTDAGKAWWTSYGQGADRRGRTGSRPFESRRPGRICAACGGIGDDKTGSECSLCDGSGRNPECSCGEGVELHPQDGWQHLDGSVSHGDRPESVSDLVHQRIGRTTPEMIQRAASFRPTKRIFGPTYGLDHRLFSRRKMRPDVRKYVLGTLDGFWRPLYGPDWQSWARVYLAGSEASEWTGPDLEGNNDFDILVGVHYDACRAVVPQFARFTDQDITDKLNADFRGQLIPRTDPVTITVDGKPVGPLSNTWYCNMASWDIKDIRPYAAYDITNDRWAVTPPHLPEWSIDAFPAGHAMIDMGEAYDALVKAILSLPEPYRTQQGNALWEHLHSDRARAFSPQGEGWYDPGNVIEKWLDQEGVWQDLWDIHHRAQTDPTTLLAPAGWSNDPKG